MRPFVKKHRLCTLVLYVLGSVGLVYCQETNNNSEPANPGFELTGGYGYFSLRKVEDVYLYATTESKGMLWGGIKVNTDERFSLALIGGYEKTFLHPKGSATDENLYISTMALMGKIYYTFYTHYNVRAYISAASGMRYVETRSLTQNEDAYLFATEVILLGLAYKPGIFSLYLEFGKSDLSVLKAGVGITL